MQAARGWIGTPYVHQASAKGAGCDCLGLLRGVWQELAGAPPEVPPPYTPDWGEPQRAELLHEAALRHLAPLEAPGPGDLLLFRMRAGSVAKHLGICTGAGFVHAWQGHGVVESAFTAPWRRRLAAAFALAARLD
ncbi:NlpC/P60 family putative phage cell wall peptidase [Pseudoroseicyclus aestuarii]|uniref:NlpC/P60 family putative phage cell wall peptidase n=1 Tax=Pseudoroseicyclus aestuarii TaxID=1795041 RepID=A0A318T5Q3_9RHOB|nr:NlpC/P60 family putative phage cell wall peptidase [Pseudoroseicyclus aestuarii]